jgi:plasmid stability protein
MAQVIIRNLEEQVVERLKARARGRGVSLEQELRDVVTAAARPDMTSIKAELAQIRALNPKRLDSDSTDLIREDRDSR